MKRGRLTFGVIVIITIEVIVDLFIPSYLAYLSLYTVFFDYLPLSLFFILL